MNEVSITNIEKLVISAILFDSSLFEETILKSKDFSNLQNQKIFQILETLYKEKLPFDEDFIFKYIPKNEKKDYENVLSDILIATPVSEIKAYELEIKENAKKIALEKLLNNSKKALEEKTSKDILKSISKELELLEDEYVGNKLLTIKSLDDIQIENPKFLLENFCPIQEGEINIFNANGGLGKSYLTLLLLLKLANEENKKCFGWFSEDTVGATKKRINSLKNTYRNIEFNFKNISIIGKEHEPLRIVEKTNRKLEVNEKFNILKRELKDYDIILLDPLIAFYGGDENDNAEARYFMTQLNKWCVDEKKTFILVHHNNKKGKDGESSVRGASAFIDACRMQYSINKDENDLYRIAKIEKTNHFSKQKEYKIKLFDIPIVYEIKKEESPKKEITKNPQNNKFSSLIS